MPEAWAWVKQRLVQILVHSWRPRVPSESLSPVALSNIFQVIQGLLDELLLPPSLKRDDSASSVFHVHGGDGDKCTSGTGQPSFLLTEEALDDLPLAFTRKRIAEVHALVWLDENARCVVGCPADLTLGTNQLLGWAMSTLFVLLSVNHDHA